MSRALVLPLALGLLMLMSVGRADEHEPRQVNSKQGINAQVRGTLHFERGHGYFISVKPADKAKQEMRVWLWIPEDKVLVRKLDGLDGKEVIASGNLEQMPRDVRASVPPLGIYLRHRFEIEHAEEK